MPDRARAPASPAAAPAPGRSLLRVQDERADPRSESPRSPPAAGRRRGRRWCRGRWSYAAQKQDVEARVKVYARAGLRSDPGAGMTAIGHGKKSELQTFEQTHSGGTIAPCHPLTARRTKTASPA